MTIIACVAVLTALQKEQATQFIKHMCARARLEVLPENIHVFTLLQTMDLVHDYHQACSANNFAPMPLERLPLELRLRVANQLMARHSDNTAIILTALPFPVLKPHEVRSIISHAWLTQRRRRR